MLQVLPAAVGRMFARTRPGMVGLTMHHPAVAAQIEFNVLSPGFEAGKAIPSDYTADGAGRSPPIVWTGAPADTGSIVLLIEDADSPSAKPLVHGIAWVAGRPNGEIKEGSLNRHADGVLPTLGRNSFMRSGYLPMDPPPGHGTHRYAFQMFAVNGVLQVRGTPGRRTLLEAMSGRVLAVGCLVGTYARS